MPVLNAAHKNPTPTRLQEVASIISIYSPDNAGRSVLLLRQLLRGDLTG